MSGGIKIGGSVQGSNVVTGDNNQIGGNASGGGKKNTVQQPPAGAARKKSEKFGILDAPGLLPQDLEAMAKKDPRWGISVIYLDIDDFKACNTRFKERVVDSELLPRFQELIASAVEDIGYAYAEGGDEIIILLPNHSQARAEFFAQELLDLVRNTTFSVVGENVSLTVSMGIASTVRTRDFKNLPNKANQAKDEAKKREGSHPGKNRFVSVR
jgi:diguanylate cyclase (GGDEF)-like protein